MWMYNVFNSKHYIYFTPVLLYTFFVFSVQAKINSSNQELQTENNNLYIYIAPTVTG